MVNGEDMNSYLEDNAKLFVEHCSILELKFNNLLINVPVVNFMVHQVPVKFTYALTEKQPSLERGLILLQIEVNTVVMKVCLDKFSFINFVSFWYKNADLSRLPQNVLLEILYDFVIRYVNKKSTELGINISCTNISFNLPEQIESYYIDFVVHYLSREPVKGYIFGNKSCVELFMQYLLAINDDAIVDYIYDVPYEFPIVLGTTRIEAKYFDVSDPECLRVGDVIMVDEGPVYNNNGLCIDVFGAHIPAVINGSDVVVHGNLGDVVNNVK